METKTCFKCGQVKLASPEFFYRHQDSKDRLNSWCKECSRAYGRDRTRIHPNPVRNKRVLAQWYSGGCIVCGLVFLPGGMHAHHRNPMEKHESVSQLHDARLGLLDAELIKCDPICASHHGMLEQAKRDCKGSISYEDLVREMRCQWKELAQSLTDSQPPRVTARQNKEPH